MIPRTGEPIPLRHVTRGGGVLLRGVTGNAMRLLWLAVVIDLIGIAPLFWTGGTPLAFAGVFGLALPGAHDLWLVPAAQSSTRSSA